MFGSMKSKFEQLQQMQRLMKDENFRAFMAHPRVQEVFRDPEFQAILKTKDPGKIMAHPKLAGLMRDPELVALMSKLNPQNFL
jgi:hypothetical protein